MLLKASKSAQYFIHDEYHQVELVEKTIVVSSELAEEHIPFLLWDGSVRVRRGICWGELEFYSHTEGDQRISWLVRGLPWQQCEDFARLAVEQYRQWHQEQCEALANYMPKWQSDLSDLLELNSYLSHSRLEEWHAGVSAGLDDLSLSIKHIQQRLPELSQEIAIWYTNSEQLLENRNTSWLDKERERWRDLFSQIESSPLNESQQRAVLLNDDNNLILAGAGSGKTSVLTARVAYLIESGLAKPEEILLLAFGKEAAMEMSERLRSRVGPAAKHVTVSTFHQLGLSIIKSSNEESVDISPLATNDEAKAAWVMDWLKKHWMTPTNYKRWQKHLTQWPIAYITGDDELGSHVEDEKLISWLVKQLDVLAMINMSKKDIQESIVNDNDFTRLNSELSLCWPCYLTWSQMLKQENHLDFNLMISEATKLVKRGKYDSLWTHIMVDEYQDISPERLELVEALCAKTRKQNGAILFAVGDDWQSIYEFAGSDVNLTTDFKIRFPNSVISYLDTTYRFNNKIGDVANQFIQKNPEQLVKELHSFTTVKKPRAYLLNQIKLERTLDDLNRGSKSYKSVLLLGRNHYHKPELFDDWQERYRNLSLKFMTCHAAKGKEADYVFILNVDDGQFPAKVKNRHLNNVLTSKHESYPNAEERRLFYVAMTRAKEKLWIAFNNKGSSFVEELRSGHYPIRQIK
ncbi:DNA helicase IV [Vibrio sp.]|nr:DNA helicase IV [Vibrio sp.]